MKKTSKEEFIKVLASVTPEEINDLILENSKMKMIKNPITRFDRGNRSTNRIH